MALRRKNDRVVVAPPVAGHAHGRLLDVAAAGRGRAEPGDVVERLAGALIERELARALKDPTKYGNANRRAMKARRALLARPDGRAEIEMVTNAVWANAGGAIRTAARAHVDSRVYAVEAALHFVRWTREHDVQSSSAVALLGAAATWMALASMLRDRTFAQDPLAFGSAIAKSDGNGAHAHRSAGELLKLAAAADTAARMNLLAALDLEARSRAGRPEQATSQEAFMKRALEMVHERRAERERAAEIRAAEPPAEGPPTLGEPFAADESPMRAEAASEPLPAAAPLLDSSVDSDAHWGRAAVEVHRRNLERIAENRRQMEARR